MKKQATLLSLIFCSILTGCYPTGQKVEKADTSSVVYDEDLNASPREDLRYYFTVPEEYLHTYSAKKAHSVIYEPDYITPLFPGCTENLELEITPETADSPDLEYYYLYQKEPASYVCVDAGTVSLLTPEYNNGCYGIFDLKGTFLRDDKTREIVPNDKLKSFSSDAAITKIEYMIDHLNVEVNSEPIIYAVTYDTDYDYYDLWYHDTSVDEDAYIIKYRMTLDGLPVPDYGRSPLVHEDWYIPETKIVSVFTESGMIYFDCREAMEITERDEEIQICSPEFAIQQVKKYVEAMTVSCSIYGCELMVLPVADNDTDDMYDYKLKPVWMFVWDKTVKEQYPDCDAIYVDAETGEIL